MTKVLQTDLSGGEVSPGIAARFDIDRYRSSLALSRNYFARVQGGVENRAGFEHVAFTKAYNNGSPQVIPERLIPFEFNTLQTYALEFGDQYIRVYTDGGLVLSSSFTKTITGITQAAAAVVTTSTAHGLTTGDEVFISGVVGMTELNGRQFDVTVVSSTTFSLQTKDGFNVDSTGYTAYSSGGLVDIPYELATPYAARDVADLYYTQSADVMTITHPGYAPRELVRLANDSWTLTEIAFIPALPGPTNLVVTPNTTGSTTDRYMVTAVDIETGEESLPGTSASATITGITQANPAVVTTSAAHGLATGDIIYISGVSGMVEVNARLFKVKFVSSTTFNLETLGAVPIDASSYTAYSSGGNAFSTFVELTNSNATRDNTLSWTALAGAGSYNVYRRLNGVFGFIGRADGTSFLDENVAPDTGDTPSLATNPFVGSGNYPSVCGFYQQRRIFANSNNKTQTLWFTQTGNLYNLATSSPARDDDAITATIASTRANEILGLVSLNDLVVLTSGAEWKISGVDDLITPSGLLVKPQTYYGSVSTRVAPIVVGETVLFLQTGQYVRDVGYRFASDNYAGNDISILARHLLENYSLVSWDFAAAPYNIVWMVRNDGVMLGLTYLREQEKFAWHQHDTKGAFLDVVALREGDIDRVYVLVERDINGKLYRFVERMADRRIDDVQDSVFLDASRTYRATELAISGVTSANPGVVTTAGGHGLSNGDIVDISGVYVSDVTNTAFKTLDTEYINGVGFTVANATGNTFELNIGSDAFDTSSMPAYVSGGVVRATTSTIANLWHLEGEEVTVLANGYVETATVSSGQLTLDTPASRVCVGLPYVAELQTLRLVNQGAGGEAIMSRSKRVIRPALLVEKTLGMELKTPNTSAVPVRFAFPAKWGQPPALVTDLIEPSVTPDWDKSGTLVVRQPDPLPSAILAILRDAHVGGN